jgi:hypothetical protein
MAPKRLSETEKQEIAERYRQPHESTATLSRAFGVSTSTIGRLLKSSFSADEYEELVQHKRLIGRGGAARAFDVAHLSDVAPDDETDDPGLMQTTPIVNVSPPETVMQHDAPKLRSRTRTRTRTRIRTTDSSVAATNHETQLGLSLENNSSEAVVAPVSTHTAEESGPDKHEIAARRRRRRSSVTATSEVIRHEPKVVTTPHPISDVADGVDNHDEEEYESEEQLSRFRKRRSRPGVVSSPPQDFPVERAPQLQSETLPRPAVTFNDSRFEASDDPLDEPYPSESDAEEFDLTQTLRVLPLTSPPLSEATLPKTCYLVVDRLSELISRPLQDFEELGEIPQGENQEQTLPIFDNHRVARRFANRSQRVMKIPDSRVLQKTGAHLQAKGITRVLIDGKVYSLS